MNTKDNVELSVKEARLLLQCICPMFNGDSCSADFNKVLINICNQVAVIERQIRLMKTPLRVGMKFTVDEDNCVIIDTGDEVYPFGLLDLNTLSVLDEYPKVANVAEVLNSGMSAENIEYVPTDEVVKK